MVTFSWPAAYATSPSTGRSVGARRPPVSASMSRSKACRQSFRAAASRARSTRPRPASSRIAHLPNPWPNRRLGQPVPEVTVRVTSVTVFLTHLGWGTPGPEPTRLSRGGLMDSATVNGVELEYEVTGSGEPVLLSSPAVPRGFLPLLSEPALADRYRMIRYHRRGWAGSTHTLPPGSIADHAADAAAFLEQLGVRRAHIAGHSSGAAVAAQLALDHPETVQTLVLLELSLLSVPSGEAFLEQAGPAFEAYGSGDNEG